jgi:small conductance mechanosensitive channel
MLDFEIASIITRLTEMLPQLMDAALVLFAFWLFNTIVRWFLRLSFLKASVHSSLVEILIDNVLWILIWIVALIVAANQLGVDLFASLTGVGFLSVAIGFAAKDSLGNIIAGMQIFWDKPFAVGDWIEVEDRFGEVKDITVRTTRIRTLDNTYIIIPNQTIINSPLINHSINGATRIKIVFSIGYGESIDWARQTLLEITSNIQYVLQDPAPDLIVRDLGESGMEMQLRVWLDDMSKEQRVRYKLNEEVRKALGDAQIEIPYPHRTIIMKK